MSFFKKPKKNIRRRPLGAGEEGAEEHGDQMDVDDEEQSMALIREKIAKAKKKEQRKQTLLSFEEDFNEADDGEVFQVRKSSQSKKMMKLLDKERKKKKEVKIEKMDTEEDAPRKDKEIVTGDLVMVVKQSEPVRLAAPVLNGRQAELADPDYQSDDEDEQDIKPQKQTQHKFSQPDNMKIILESGRIPDAAMIHAARKRRQRAREMGGDFIPIEDTQKYNNSSTKSRLVREDDNDNSDDEEEPVQMAVPSAARDRDRKREAFMSVQNDDSDHESDKGEEEEWESQQIRKGVTGAQLAAVQHETLYQQQYSMPLHPSTHLDASSVAMDMSPSNPCLSENTVETGSVIEKRFSVLKSENGIDTPQNISAKLKERLKDLQEVHRRHCLDRDQVTDDLVATQSEVQRLEAETPKLAERFRFYQELRGYVTDLVECLDEKVGSSSECLLFGENFAWN
ncbi:PAX3- and PAX7-binding protein 1 [Frankliniella fusca]|uniref:PAX3- and PAX7-binding protein 1 n=1 Tax=Frankliniella fusca TaxID=407009 RepID=A0AAE1H0D5_9NEOP|nr:PAX3- and PAX7-binding protein 1 [Frankliniella fusca]